MESKKTLGGAFRALVVSLFMVATFVFFLIAGSYVMGVLGRLDFFSSESFKLIYLLVFQLLLYLFVFFLFRVFVYAEKPAALRTNRPTLFYIQLAVLAYLMTTLTYSLFVYIEWPPSESEEVLEQIFRQYPWFAYLSALVMAPICEELFFRHFIFNTLRKHMGPFWTIFFSALLFGLFHMNLRQFIFTPLLGIVLGAVYEKSRNLKHCVFIHFVFNLVSLTGWVLTPHLFLIVPLTVAFFVFMMKSHTFYSLEDDGERGQSMIL